MYGVDINHHFFRQAIAEHWDDIPKGEQHIIQRDVEYCIFDPDREHEIDPAVIADWEQVRKNWQ